MRRTSAATSSILDAADAPSAVRRANRLTIATAASLGDDEHVLTSTAELIEVHTAHVGSGWVDASNHILAIVELDGATDEERTFLP